MDTTPLPPPTPAMGALDAPPRFPILLFLIVWLAIVLMATLVTFILPEWFASTTRIKIGPDQPDIRAFSGQPTGTNAFDPYFLQTEFETIQSEAVLGRVIDELNLNDVWGKKYLDGGKLKTSESLMLLRGRLDLRPVRNTSLLDIRVLSENAHEARDLANRIAKTYRNWRLDQSVERARQGLKSLEGRAKLQDEEISWKKQKLAELAASSGGTQQPAYLYQQKELEEAIAFRSEITRRMNLEETDLHLPRNGQVMILEAAIASTEPDRPNKPLNIVLGIIVGALAGFLLAMLVYAMRRWTYQQNTGNSGTTNLRGLRTFFQVSVALLVGALVGYQWAMPLSRVSLFLMFLFIVVGGVVIGYVATAKTTPLPPKADADNRLGYT